MVEKAAQGFRRIPKPLTLYIVRPRAGNSSGPAAGDGQKPTRRGPDLKSELKKILKARAHSLSPVVITGQNGITPAVLNEIELALDHHELIKVRVNAADRDERAGMVAEIVEATRAEVVQAVGHVVALYRKNPLKAVQKK
jgi:RNA-binding protein